MENCCTPRCIAMKMLILGAILVLVRTYTAWDIWIVLGVILLIKGIILVIMPVCPCQNKQARKK